MIIPHSVGVGTGATDKLNTCKLADAAALVPVLALTVTLLLLAPVVLPVTFTAKLHELPAGNDPLDNEITLLPATALMAPPPQELLSPFGVATTRPAGSVFVKPRLVAAPPDVAGLAIEYVRLVEPFNGVLAEPKDWLIVGGMDTINVTSSKPPTVARPASGFGVIAINKARRAVVPARLETLKVPEDAGTTPYRMQPVDKR